MYLPEELPPPGIKQKDMESRDSGKRTYHGGHELVASNYMEVLDVLSFAGKADVYHWLEEDDNLSHKLYWRQTFNRKTQALSVSTNLSHTCTRAKFWNRNYGNTASVAATSTRKRPCSSATIQSAKSGFTRSV